MAILGTFSSFTAARLGIYASQASLQVTGNNIANINTPGYTRQRGDLFSLNATGLAKYATGLGPNVGYGVLMTTVSQIRDPFLDIRYRNQNTKTAAAEATLAGLRKIAQTLDEVNKGGTSQNGVIENALQDLKTMLQQLATDVGSEEYDGLVREAAKGLTTFFNTAADKLDADWKLQVEELKDAVTAVNKCLTNIRDLNEQIRKQGIYGDNALELRDHRNLYIDELSTYLGIDVEYSMERIDQYTEVEKLTIYLKDSEDPRNPGHKIKLVDGLYAGQLSFSIEEINPDYNAAQQQTQQLYTGDTINDETGERYKYVDENGEPTDDITKANMVLLNPEYESYPRAANPEYDPKQPSSEEDNPRYLYINDEGEVTTTDNPNMAARVRNNPDYAKSVALPNPKYNENNNPPGDRYLKANGETTDNEWEAAHVWQVDNPAYDPEDPDAAPQYLYLDANREEIDLTPFPADTPLDEENSLAAIQPYLNENGDPTGVFADAVVGKYISKDGGTTNDPEAAKSASRKYIAAEPDAFGNTTTNDPEKAAKADEDINNLKHFLLQVERLEDKFGVPMNRGIYADGREKESVAIPLNDTVLQGAIQAMRELLTEEGEFASLKDVGKADGMTYSEIRAADAQASIKKGIPYYRKRLDLLAQEIARVFNEANQMSASRVYESTGKFSSSSLWYETGSVSYVTKRVAASTVYDFKTDQLPGTYVLGSPHTCFLKSKDNPYPGSTGYHPDLAERDADPANHIKGIITRDSKGNIIDIEFTDGPGSEWIHDYHLEEVKKQAEERGDLENDAVYNKFIGLLKQYGRLTSEEGQGCFVEDGTGDFLIVKQEADGTITQASLNPNGQLPAGCYYLTLAEVERAASVDSTLYGKYLEFLREHGDMQDDPSTLEQEEVFLKADGTFVLKDDRIRLTRDELESAKATAPDLYKRYLEILEADGNKNIKNLEDGQGSVVVYEDCFLTKDGLPIMIDDGAGGKKPLTRADVEAAKASDPKKYTEYLELLNKEGVRNETGGGVCVAEDLYLSRYGTEDNPVYITNPTTGMPLTRADLEDARVNNPAQYVQLMALIREEGTEIDDGGPRFFWNKDNGMYIAVSVDKDGNVVEDYENGTDLTTDMVDWAEQNDPKLYAQYLDILREHGLLKEEYNYYDGGVLFSNNGDNNDPTGINARNISISHDWSARIVRVLNSKKPNEVDGDGNIIDHSSANDNILHLISLFDTQMDYCASNLNELIDNKEEAAGGNKPFFHGTFQEMYTDLGATLGMEQNIMDGIAYNYEVMSLDLDNDRISVYGVDLNDEATSMMQFQKSYQAACRLLTTIDAMLDTLINRTI